MTNRRHHRTAALLVTASAIAIATPASALETVFATDRGATVEPGQRMVQTTGLTQVRLDNGAVASFVDAADYRINADGSVELFAGSVTVAGGQGATIVRMPEGVEGRIEGRGSAASFSVAGDGSVRGHVMSGTAGISNNGSPVQFAAGQMWRVDGRGNPHLVVSNGEQSAPPTGQTAQVADMTDGGPVAAAGNGVPVTLGDALAAAGAAGDIVGAARRVEAAAGNPQIGSFPTGDLALLVAYAAQLQGEYYGHTAGADIIRTYLGYLAGGGTGANFLTAYAGFLTQYLDLVRSGALPSGFKAASLADINAYIAYLGQTSGFGSLSSANRSLVEAYLAFLQGGGNPDLFASRYTDLVNAYFAYVRGGGDPAAFTGATQATLNQYIAFLNSSGLLAQLSASNRALLQAYLANGGFAFTAQYKTALDAYFAYLAAGNKPSGYTAIDAATLRTYLETLKNAGLFDQVLGAQAQFYAGYLAYLQGGGAIDGYAGLNANVFAGYASQLAAFYAYIQAGGLPTGYTGDVAKLFEYLAALKAAGALEAFLGGSAGFYTDYLAFVQGGGDVSLFARLPGLNLDSFADALNAYAAFIAGGGLPSGYSAESLAKLAEYFTLLRNSGRIDGLLGGNASALTAYFTYLAGGGTVDGFSGLPVYSGYVSALNAYYAFLAAGGLPSAYTALTQAQIRAYLDALAAAGGIGAYTGLQGFFSGYYAYLANGGTVAGYSGLPVYADYVSALNLYYAYLAAGGLPQNYTALTADQIKTYLAALQAAGGLSGYASLEGFFSGYYAYLAGGGDPANYGGIPVYADYLAALQAYYDFLAAGGLPSAYSKLTQAQIQAYLLALRNSGVLQASLTADELKFVLDYLAFVQGGGNPDQFAALPVNNAGVTLAAGARVWNFSSEGGRTGIAPTAQIAADGTIEKYTYAISPSSTITFDYASSSNQAKERGRIGGDVAWTRYRQGVNSVNSVNQNVHLLIGVPATGLPASGKVDYKLVGGTVPTDYYAAPNSEGSFSGQLAVAFGATPKVGLSFDVYSGTRGWHAQTAGGATDPSNGGLLVDSNMAFASLDLPHSKITGDACSEYCNIQVFGGLFGAGAGSAGFEYFIDDQSGGSANRDYINGVAVFGTTGTALKEIGTRPSTGTPTVPTGIPAAMSGYSGGFNPAVANVNMMVGGRLGSSNGFAGGESGFQTTAFTLGSSGSVLSYTRTGGTTRTNGSAVVDNVYGNANVIIGRWRSGTNTGANVFTMSDNQGLHYMLARPLAVALPTSGRIDYYLTAATPATIADGSYAPGTFAAQMAILFGSTNKLALQGSITMPTGGSNYVFNFATAGGIADPTQSTNTIAPNAEGHFNTLIAGATDGTSNCTGSNQCSLSFYGSFAKDQNTVGATYQANVPFSGKSLVGSAIFQAGTERTPTPTPTPAPTPSGSFTGTRTGIAYYTYTNGSLATGFGGGADLVNGELVKFTSAIGTVDKASTSIVEAGDATALAWARWTGGTVETRGVLGNADTAVGANGGYHVMAGTPATSLPASGIVDYQLVGTTKPTDNQGSAPGTLTGSLAVSYGSTSRVGFDMNMQVGGRGWAVQTPGGGSLSPSTSPITITNGSGGPTFSSTFTSTGNTVTASGGACMGTCLVNVGGVLFGTGASHIGVAMNVTDTSVQNGTIGASGLLIFAKP